MISVIVGKPELPFGQIKHDDVKAQMIPQFWDGERLLGKEVSRSLGVDPTHASWDIYLFYPPEAEWTDAGLPPPAKIVQAMGVVIGGKGTLPPKGDQTRVPKWAEGRADVVGEQSELGNLLTAIVVPFVEQYKSTQATGAKSN